MERDTNDAPKNPQHDETAAEVEVHDPTTLTLATAAHELKNALAPVALRLARFELAAKAGRVASVEEVRQARTEVRRLSALVNELMDDARLQQTGRDLCAHASFDLVPLLTDLVVATASAWEGRRSLTVGPLPSSAPLEGDSARLRAVLENYLDNADKFSPAGSPVEISVQARGGQLRVTVSDRGPGIAQADQARLFTRFFRAAATAKQTRGFGLGLYLCRQIALAHGGRVGVDTEAGAGASFWIELPIATNQALDTQG